MLRKRKRSERRSRKGASKRQKPRRKLKAIATGAEKRTVSITAAKGRPMLTWVGKRSLEQITPFPAQQVETFSPPLPKGLETSGVDWEDWPTEYPREIGRAHV